jgi:4-oxalocrotonate tautomerase
LFIQITVFNTREPKKALFRRLAELLGNSPGIRPEVYILEAAKADWSVGHGLAHSPEARRCSFETGFDMS